MTKIISIVFIAILSIQTITGQENKELNIITSGKWYLTIFEKGLDKRTFEENLKENNWMKFHSDGKHEVMTFGNLDIAEWQLSDSKKKIKMINKGRKFIYEITTLNKNNLVLKREEEDIQFIMTFKK